MIFETQQQAKEYIEQVNNLLGYPDKTSDTLTYAIEIQLEDKKWFVPTHENINEPV